MSSYAFYLFVDAIHELVSALAPVLVAVVVCTAGLIGWRWHLTRRTHAVIERVAALETRIGVLEHALERGPEQSSARAAELSPTPEPELESEREWERGSQQAPDASGAPEAGLDPASPGDYRHETR